jgi:16S rRNA pseudouridine516 synthase
VKLLKHLANLGYGSRKEVAMMLRNGWVTDAAGNTLDEGSRVDHEDVRVDDEPLDPAPGMLLMLHKPTGYTCSTKDTGRLIYDLLPERYRLRNPVLSSVGRLDRDTSGLLLMTDDGALLHRITSPKSHLPKVYVATLASELRGDEAAAFASGTLMLDGEKEALAPATLEALSAREARVTTIEGRYHQVRRMFAALGNHVEALRRERIGGLELGALAPGQCRLLGEEDRAKLFAAG